jgi:osmotically-inducible protein OsmY
MPGPKGGMMIRKDEEIKKDVVDQLYWDSRIDASKITVEVEEGVVRISGTVPTYTARQCAYRDAFSIEGVTWVDNDIAVLPAAGGPTDSEIEANVSSALGWNPDLVGTVIDVIVRYGWVTLEGSVATFWQKQHAEDVASNVNGVVGITNSLAVAPTGDYEDEVIGEEILTALGRHSEVDVNDINVLVANGSVTLSGKVPTWSARLAAYEAALFTGGVVNIHDDLRVSP